jgi:hypothetical protein
MSKHHFHGPAKNVAAGDIIENNYSSDTQHLLDPGPQEWAVKYYVVGNRITSGWLFLLTSLLFFIIAISQIVYALQSLVGHKHIDGGSPVFFLRFGASIIVAVTAGWAGQIWWPGFVGLHRTQFGLARDINRHVFIGRLDGEGSFCPTCKVKLHFHVLGLSPVLRCTRNGDHCWPFDFTAVKE